jgi:hypothetical protein
MNDSPFNLLAEGLHRLSQPLTVALGEIELCNMTSSETQFSQNAEKELRRTVSIVHGLRSLLRCVMEPAVLKPVPLRVLLTRVATISGFNLQNTNLQPLDVMVDEDRFQAAICLLGGDLAAEGGNLQGCVLYFDGESVRLKWVAPRIAAPSPGHERIIHSRIRPFATTEFDLAGKELPAPAFARTLLLSINMGLTGRITPEGAEYIISFGRDVHSEELPLLSAGAHS